MRSNRGKTAWALVAAGSLSLPLLSGCQSGNGLAIPGLTPAPQAQQAGYNQGAYDPNAATGESVGSTVGNAVADENPYVGGQVGGLIGRGVSGAVGGTQQQPQPQPNTGAQPGGQQPAR